MIKATSGISDIGHVGYGLVGDESAIGNQIAILGRRDEANLFSVEMKSLYQVAEAAAACTTTRLLLDTELALSGKQQFCSKQKFAKDRQQIQAGCVTASG